MSEPRKKLVLIDGHALAYRQFHGIPIDRFTTMSGEPTNATFGVARRLLDILQSSTPPDYLAMTFDQGLSGREQQYSAYKANREDMQDALTVQINRIRQLTEAFNIPILEKAGFEADDVIGSVAKVAVERGIDVYIITGDRDLMQLVNDHVTIELPPNTQRGEKDPHIYNVAKVVERFGITPEQYVDYKAFTGDSSDNIPGVTGIGDKGAAQLIQQFGTLENIYASLDLITGSKRTKLEQGRDNAFLSRDLSRIKTDIPLDFDLEKCVAHDYDVRRVATLFRELEFRSLATRLPQAPETASADQQMAMFDAEAPADNMPQPHYIETVVVDTPEALIDLVKILDSARAISFDTETTDTDQVKADLVGISIAVDGATGYYIPVGHTIPDARQLPIEQVMDALRPAFTDLNKPKWAHNATYDTILMIRYGVDVTPITFDTMVAEWLINPDSRRKGLKDMAQDRLNVTMTHIEELIGKGKNQVTMDKVPIEKAAPYAAADAAIAYRLFEVLEPKLEAEGLLPLMSNVEMPLVPVIADLDLNGAKVELNYLAQLNQELEERLNTIAEKMYEQAGERFQIGSLKQLNDILFTKLQIPTKGLKKTNQGYSTDADTLESLIGTHPIVETILEWRALEKLRNTYVSAIPKLVDEQSRVHTTYNQTGSVTGRISSDKPNLQNIPIRTEEGRRVRRAFIAPEGFCLLGVDYSQIELRILASFSGDEFLRNAFQEDLDIHRATAAAVSNIPFEHVTKEQRYFAKRVNFGLMYGMGAHRLARESGLPFAEAQAFIQRYFERFPGVQRYFAESIKEAKEKGFLTTQLGRRRYFHVLKQEGGGLHQQRARAEREAMNMPIQATAADIIKIAMIHLGQSLKAECPQARMILQVHDELVFEVPSDQVVQVANFVRGIMENEPLKKIQLDVPLRADANFGTNWADMQPVEEYGK